MQYTTLISKSILLLLGAALPLVAFPITVHGFAIGGGLEQTRRWSLKPVGSGNNAGLKDKLQWNLENNFLNSLTFAEGTITLENLTQAVNTAFSTWENVAKSSTKISDSVSFIQGGKAIVGEPGTEISIFARPKDYQIPEEKVPLFPSDNILGITIRTFIDTLPISTATEIRHNVGKTIIDADIYLQSSETWTLNPSQYSNASDFIGTLVHEIGHALGLDHPDKEPFFDTDNDLNNLMEIDPFKPEETPNLNQKANPKIEDFQGTPVMVSTGGGTTLSNDDISGLMYLYPECPPDEQPQLRERRIVRSVVTPSGCQDYGDAPDSYRTTLLKDGPRYQEGDLQRLGSEWDIESDGQPTIFADGDDRGCGCNGELELDDEDGVIFGKNWVDVILNITRSGVNNYQLSAWWDTGEDGVFDHPSERYINELLSLAPGIHKMRFGLSFNPKDFYSRFRLTWEPTQEVLPFGEVLSSDGISHGEVEDYPPRDSLPVPEPSSTLSFLALGTLGVGTILQRSKKQKFAEK